MEALNWNVGILAQVIQVSVAPVFLLAGISGILTVLTNRLARTIDRSRSLQAANSTQLKDQQKKIIERELKHLLNRSRYSNLAITLATISALMVCLVVVTLFLGSLIQIKVSAVVASLFIVCMLFLSASLTFFLAEVFVATRSLRASLISTESYRISHE